MARGWTCVVHHAAAHAAPRDTFCNTRGKTGEYARERERKRERKKMREKEGEKEAERERGGRFLSFLLVRKRENDASCGPIAKYTDDVQNTTRTWECHDDIYQRYTIYTNDRQRTCYIHP